MAVNPVKVSQLNTYIHRLLQSDPLLGDVCVCGEISNFKVHSTGIYFSLKDDNSRVSCYMRTSVYKGLRFAIDNGMEIIVYGSVEVYKPNGTYSIIVKDVDVQGAGNRAIAFENLKKKLKEEGLFDEKYKKPIPKFPDKIAVVTSDTGAAVQDIQKIITEKNNYADILIFPVLVQGPGAAPDIVRAIKLINSKYKNVDVMIVGRGGGSMDELWAFNEEIVARAIFESEVPVISAVGHETDFTIADFVADLRAETPTAAANIAAPDIEQIKEFCTEQCETLKNRFSQLVEYKTALLQSMDVEHLKKQLLDRIRLAGTEIDALMAASKLHAEGFISRGDSELSRLYAELSALNPENVIKRGYAAITDESGNLITSVKDVKKDDIIRSVLKDGSINSAVCSINKEPANRTADKLLK